MQHQHPLPNKQHSSSTTQSDVFLHESKLFVLSMHIRRTLLMVQCVGQKQHVEATLLHNGSHVDGRVPTSPLLDSNDECERLGVPTNDLPNLSRSVNQNMPPTHWWIVVHCPFQPELTIHIVLDRNRSCLGRSGRYGKALLSSPLLLNLGCLSSCRRCLPLRFSPTWVS